MEIKTQCPHCLGRYLVDDDMLGESIRCVRCEKAFEVKEYLPPAPPQRAKLRLKAAVDVVVRGGADAAEKRVPHLGLELAAIPPGSFRQGAEGGYLSERPVRTVHLTYPFWMSRCLITQAQFREVMARNPSYFEGDDLPVESVTWQEALEFCRRLTEIERVAKRISPSLHFRLPTEAEWEYACRAGLRPAAEGQEEPAELRAFWRGDPEALKAYAWFDLDSEETPHPVGTLKPNPWGLYDLLGNVAEWCMDWYGPYPEGEVTDPKGPEAGRRKVRRGGGWASVARRCRAADRIGVAPATASGLIGFRVVAVRIGEPPFSYNYHVW